MSPVRSKPRSAKATLVRIQFEQSLNSSLVHLPMCLYTPLVDRSVSPQSLVVEIDPQEDGPFSGGGGGGGGGGGQLDRTPQQPYYAGWTGMSAAPLNAASTFGSGAPSSSSSASLTASITDVVSMSPSLAASFRPPLAEGAICSIRLLRSPPLPTADKIEVTPLTPDDWEILSIHAEEVEINMLGQVRAARTGQVIGVHVGRAGKTVVRFRVDATTPATSSAISDSAASDTLEMQGSTSGLAVRLSTDSEVIIAPRLRKKVEDTALAEEEHDLNAGRAGVNGNGVGNGNGQLRDQTERREAVSKLLWRVLPDRFGRLPRSEDWLQSAVLLPPTEVASASAPSLEVMNELFPKGRIAVTKVSCPSSDPSAKGGSTTARSDVASGKAEPEGEGGSDNRPAHRDLPARPTASAFYASGGAYLDKRLGSASKSDPDSSAWPERHVLVGPALRQQLGIQDYDLLRFTSAPPGSSVRSSANGSKAAGDGDDHVSGESSDESTPNLSKTTLAGVDAILDTCLETISGTLRSRRLHAASSQSNKPFSGSSGLLLTGGPGAGKTVVAAELAARLSSNFDLVVSSAHIDCSPFSEERVPALRAKFSEWLNEAAWKGPSLLVLDNIDRILPAEVEHVDSQRSRQLAEAFVARVRDCVKDYEVFVLATAQSNTSIHALLNSSHLWIDNVQLKPPSKEGRREILSQLVYNKTSSTSMPSPAAVSTAVLQDADSDLNFVTLATQTEGYLPADLKDLVERAVHQSAIQSASEHFEMRKESAAIAQASVALSSHPQLNGDAAPGAAVNGLAVAPAPAAAEAVPAFRLTMADFAKAQEGFTPLSLRDVKLEKSSVAWSDIGGLVETRRVLRETLEWPTKYSAIFAGCPLRLRSGLLLYGYPGCGKTLLASAVAKECGLNFISVKGPEILNKYIGASEKSVRDLFDRAQAAKPCVLFFDEFDSIAPKRGHDSTGVTDRVVNQMLTQMDGAEGLDGVYVLAATSRPDLIDSALLRPGRLDKSLLCDMPTLDDRVDIIKAIARKVHLDPSVDVATWAKRTEGYSGADLQALLYNAHLETIHESINAAAAGGDPAKPDKNARDGPDDGRPVKFISFGGGASARGGGEGAKKTLSGAEQQALSRKLELVLQNQRQTSGTHFAAGGPGLDADDGSTATSKKAERSGKKVLVQDSHLEGSLKATRPSVPLEEQRRLRRIYKSFAGERDAHFPDGEASDQIGARSSLM